MGKTAQSIELVADSQTHSEIIALRKRKLAPVYPTMDFDNDVLDNQALIFYTRDARGKPDTTVRFTFEGKLPLPEHEYLGSYRDSGKRVMELGRFVKTEGSMRLLKQYYRTAYCIAKRLGFDVIVMAMQPGHIEFHERMMGLNIIARTTGVTYGGKYDLACVAWEIEHTQAAFHKWIAK